MFGVTLDFMLQRLVEVDFEVDLYLEHSVRRIGKAPSQVATNDEYNR